MDYAAEMPPYNPPIPDIPSQNSSNGGGSNNNNNNQQQNVNNQMAEQADRLADLLRVNLDSIEGLNEAKVKFYLSSSNYEPQPDKKTIF